MRVLVVGAGIGGLATASSLRAAGCAVSVVERTPRRSDEGFSITIPSNGTRALDALGVLGQVRAAAVEVQRFEYVWRDDTLLSVSLDDGFGGWPWLALPRRDLLDALATAAGEVNYGRGVTAVYEEADDDDVNVGVTFEDSTVERFDVVVGADGVASVVRQCMSGGDEPAWAGLLYYRALIDDPDWPPVMRGFLGDGRLFGLFPGGPGRVYGWGALPASSSTVDPVAGRRQRLLDAFSSLGDEPRRFLERTRSDEDFSCTPPAWVRTDHWHTSRVALIGDAAHACPPFMAEGACLAMEDGLVLADCLTSMEPIDAALASYAARRRPRALHVHAIVHAAASSVTNPASVETRVERLRAGGPQMMRAQFDPLLEPI